MSIATYADLKAKISTFYEERADLAAVADDFIALAEGYFNVKLRCREMEATEPLTPSSNVCTLPSDYLEYKRVVEVVSPRRPLAYITEDGADRLYPFREAGLSNHFMIVGSSLTALPLSSNNIELTYYQKIPALNENNATNWLLDRLPALYLHACLMYAAEYTKNNEQMVKEGALAERYIGDLMALDHRSKFGNAGVTIPGAVF